MDLKDIKEILELLDDKEIAEFELEEEGMKLRIRKAAPSTNHLPPEASPPPVRVGVAPAPPPSGAATPSTGAELAPEEGDPTLAIVKSPIVGTFYRSPDPNAAPFVKVGDPVRVGQVLCIIEAMKLMNEIESEVAGEIVRIHHENGQPVQYGEPLFSIRPDR